MAECKGIKSDGQPCRAHPKNGADYCFLHDPARGGEAAQARKRGGQRVRPGHAAAVDALPAQVRTLDDVLAVLDYSLREALPLENSVARGRLLVAIAHAFIEAIKTGELENRMAAIEAALKVREGVK